MNTETTRLDAIRLSTEWAEGFKESQHLLAQGSVTHTHLLAASTELLTAFKNVAGIDVTDYPADALTDLISMMDALHALSHDGALPDEVWVDSPTGAYDLYSSDLSAIYDLFVEMATATPVGAYNAA